MTTSDFTIIYKDKDLNELFIIDIKWKISFNLIGLDEYKLNENIKSIVKTLIQLVQQIQPFDKTVDHIVIIPPEFISTDGIYVYELKNKTLEYIE